MSKNVLFQKIQSGCSVSVFMMLICKIIRSLRPLYFLFIPSFQSRRYSHPKSAALRQLRSYLLPIAVAASAAPALALFTLFLRSLVTFYSALQLPPQFSHSCLLHWNLRNIPPVGILTITSVAKVEIPMVVYFSAMFLLFIATTEYDAECKM